MCKAYNCTEDAECGATPSCKTHCATHGGLLGFLDATVDHAAPSRKWWSWLGAVAGEESRSREEVSSVTIREYVRTSETIREERGVDVLVDEYEGQEDLKGRRQHGETPDGELGAEADR